MEQNTYKKIREYKSEKLNMKKENPDYNNQDFLYIILNFI